MSPDPKADGAYIPEMIREAIRPLLSKGCFIDNNSSFERMLEAARRGDWIQGAPDLVVEISSPSNRRLQSKADLYLRHGAAQVWTVYPKRRVVIVSTQDGPREAREDETVDFGGVVLNVRDLFAF